ncbi:MAG: hypothetical protein GDA36_11050 [Rhodobacteraceae bacterium]|nr:hypothetical protein [Paracoccaceae bacterium]
MAFYFTDPLSDDSFYSDCFTLNPRKVAHAWDKLNADTAPMMVGLLPMVLHGALLETLAERRPSDRSNRKQNPEAGEVPAR